MSTKKKTPTKKTPKAKAPKKQGAVAKVWEIASKMPKADRKDVLAACAKAGINENTAKTQYQRWLHRGDKKAA
jgi:hypothetical protein